MEALWTKAPGTRYPVYLAVGGAIFFATQNCKEDEQVNFRTKVYPDGSFGGIECYYVDKPGEPEVQGSDRTMQHEAYMRVCDRSTRSFHIVRATAQEHRFGGIVVQPAAGTDVL